MKKTILAFALLGSGAIAVAQDSLGKDYNTMQKANTMQNANATTTLQSSTGNYNAYSTTTNVPSTTQSFLVRDYPTATNPVWEQSGEWYRATYLDNNRSMHVYYAPNGSSYAVALPVIQSWVPENVVTTALNQFGNNIYAINKIRAANGNEVYQVTLLENGQTRNEYIGMDGQSVTAADIFLVPGVEMNQMNSNSMNAAKDNNNNTNVNVNNNTDVNNNTGVMTNSDMNNNSTDKNIKTKTKVKHTDGHEMKTKTKNGKTRVKESNPDNINQ
jgi:hypothetical protein